MTPAEMERLLQYTRIRKVHIWLETADGDVFQMQCAPGTASLTMGHLPQDLDFLEQPVMNLLGSPYIVLVFRPDSPLNGAAFRIDQTGTLPLADSS